MNTMFAAFLGGWEWVVVILAVVLLFGSKRIPDVARSLGQGIREFKKATREMTDEIQNATTDTPPPKPLANDQPPSAPAVSQSSTPPKT
jgi:sec-independent protein translocase protein TatA